MSSLKHLFQSNLIKAVFIGLIILSLLCASTVRQQFEKMEWIEEQLAGYEWLIPLGMYAEISVAEIGDTVYFLTGTGEEGNRKYAVYQWNGTTLKINNEGKLYLLTDRNGLRTEYIHPSGYWIWRGPGESGGEHITDVKGNVLSGTFEKFTLQLTEQPGYSIDMGSNTVISLETRNILYTAPENERITGQMGDYWIMERDIPWAYGKPLTVMYLRNMDFSMALDGMLFDSVYEVEDGKICGTVITTGTYDVLPEEVIAVEERIVEADGSWTPLFAEAGQGVILGAGDGYYVTRRHETEETMIHFFDGTEPAVIEGGMEPFGPCRDGVIAFYDKDTFKQGFLNRKGEVAVEAIFSECSGPHMDTAVVVHNGQYGVLRLKGGDGDD